MTFLTRLRALTAALGVAAAIVAVGTTLFGDVRGGPGSPPAVDPTLRPDGGKVIDELAVTKFSQLPVLTYQVRSGEVLFAWQIKPTLDPAPARPRDVLVLVDTSASQAGKPLLQARQILTALTEMLTGDDRVSVWTVSTPAATKAITQDFQPANSEAVKNAAAALTEVEYGSGATDLKYGLSKSVATMSPNRARQQLVLFLGDGESAFNPVSEGDRVAIGGEMDRNDVFFFAVPLGVKVDPANLHGFAALTGGTVVRIQEDLNNPTKRTEFITRLKTALDVPVLKADKYKFGDEVAELYPTKLPPLRADKPTLVMGKLAKAAPAVTATVSGKVAGRAVNLTLSQPLPASQADHFFLNLMMDQWRGAPNKDAPAILQADRALALASTQVKLYRDEFLSQAVWAVTKEQYDEAAKLYGAAKKIDPNDTEANAGLVLVEQMKAGKVTKADLQKRVNAKATGLQIGKEGAARQVVKDLGEANAQQPPPAGGGGAQPPVTGNPPNAQDLLNEAKARRQVAEQQTRVLVDTTIRRGRQLLRTDPDAAYQDLKRQRDEVIAYEGISDPVRRQLVADLEAVMQEIFVKGGEIKRQAADERDRIAQTRQRMNEFEREQSLENHTKAHIDAFRQLMHQARYELAYQEAQIMIQERIRAGQSVPAATTATYIIGQQATQLREWRELVRIREDRFLLTMMQVEKSNIPYPDEPPVHFPPAAVWRELTGQRKERYENSVLGAEASATQQKIQSALENQRVSYEKNLNETPVIDLLQDMAKRYDVSFIIMTEYFKAEGQQDIRDAKPNLTATKLEGLTLGGFLDIVLQSVNATYIVRPDYIEVTTFNRRLEEKVTRVFPVADLAIPIPNSVNRQTLFQNQQFQNSSLAIFGAASLYGGGLANFVGFNGQGGGQGGLGGPGGNLGLGGGGMGGGVGFGGGNTGSIVGQGGNVGQFGNLGGQFGLQGGDQSQLLIRLILETVAKGEWANTPPPPGQPGGGGMDMEESVLSVQQRNSIGYYPPARALIVRGTSRYHTAASVKLKKGDAMAAAPGRPNPNGGVIVIGPGGAPKPVGDPNANVPKDPVVKGPPKPAADPAPPIVIAGGKPTLVEPKVDAAVLAKQLDKAKERKWQQAIDWTVSDPGLIVACAEFLMEFDEYGDAAEILKANLRKGLATDDWAHEALAIALQMSQGNPIDIERAAVSAIDLNPTDPKAYLRAAKVEADLKNSDQAIAFCKRAAAFAPDQPTAYANALVYAEKAADVKSDAVDWAMGNLLRRDWPADGGIDYHAKAKDMLPKFVARFQAAGIKADNLQKALIEQKQRDLVIELVWSGQADLDLIVAEPSGAVCSATAKRTTGGGFLKADQLDQKDDPNLGSGGRTEVYTAASAFTGTYKLSVKKAFGNPIGGTAQIKVTKFKGTPKESFDLITVDLRNPKPIEVKLDGGSRTELAAVTEEVNEFRQMTTGAPASSGPSGFGGGVGPAGSAFSSEVGGSSSGSLPVVSSSTDTRLPGVGGSADLRMGVKLNPDRQSVTVNVNPVFATTGGKDVPMPKVPLLPGSEK